MRWWSQLWSASTATNFPLLKSIVNFEEAKEESNLWKDWRVTRNETILHNYLLDIKKDDIPTRMLWAGGALTYECDGKVTIKA